MSKPTALTLQDKAAWLLARRHGIGGSDAAAVLGENPYRTPLEVYADKLGQAPVREDTEQMRMGLLLEPVIARLYAEETTREVLPAVPFTILRSADHPFMTATLDAEVRHPERGPGVLQIKTAGAYHADEWASGPPLMYQIQLQHEIAVAGYAWGSLAVLIGGQRFLWLDVDRDDRFIARMVEGEAEFWARVLSQQPPDPRGVKADRDLLAHLYPTDTGEVVTLDAEGLAWDEQRLQAIQELAAWEAKKDEAENRIKAAMGAASVAVLPNGVRYTWTASERKAYLVKATTVRALRRKSR